MFKRSQKRLDEENSIVDYLIQTYADASIMDSKMLCYINEKAKCKEEKREMLIRLDRYNTLLCSHQMFDRLKKMLFSSAKSWLTLTHIELSVCFLVSTKKYHPEAIIDILWIDKERFVEIVQSLEAKLSYQQCRLPKGYREMQPLIYEYCSMSCR